MAQPDTLVSICLCTYRREHLKDTLESLNALALPDGVSVEIVIADNDAEGSAALIVEALRPEMRFPIRYEIEPQKGISHARNRTLSMATGDWLAFMDDDEVVEPDWIKAHYECATRLGADLLMGIVHPRFAAQPSRWILDSRLYDRPIGPTGTRARVARTGNAFLRASLVRERNIRFDPAYGLSGAEDNEFFSRVGAVPVCNRQAVVWETLPAERMTLSYLENRAACMGKAQARIYLARTGITGFLKVFTTSLAKTVLGAFLWVILRPINKGQSYFFRVLMKKHAAKFAFLFEKKLDPFYE